MRERQENGILNYIKDILMCDLNYDLSDEMLKTYAKLILELLKKAQEFPKDYKRRMIIVLNEEIKFDIIKNAKIKNEYIFSEMLDSLNKDLIIERIKEMTYSFNNYLFGFRHIKHIKRIEMTRNYIGDSMNVNTNFIYGDKVTFEEMMKEISFQSNLNKKFSNINNTAE